MGFSRRPSLLALLPALSVAASGCLLVPPEPDRSLLPSVVAAGSSGNSGGGDAVDESSLPVVAVTKDAFNSASVSFVVPNCLSFTHFYVGGTSRPGASASGWRDCASGAPNALTLSSAVSQSVPLWFKSSAGVSSASQPVSFEIDPTAPSAASGLGWRIPGVEESCTIGCTSHSTTLEAVWTRSTATDLSIQQVDLYSSANCSGSVLSSLSELSAESESGGFEGVNDGVYSFKITSTDVAGNSTTSDCSTGITIDEDTTAPTLSFDSADPAAVDGTITIASRGVVTLVVTIADLHGVSSGKVVSIADPVLIAEGEEAFPEGCEVSAVDAPELPSATITRTITVSGCTGPGRFRVQMPQTSVLDWGGNQLASAWESAVIEVKAPPATLTISGLPNSGFTSIQEALEITVTALDSVGAPVSIGSVKLELLDELAELAPSLTAFREESAGVITEVAELTQTPDGSGVATFSGTQFRRRGKYRLKASYFGDADSTEALLTAESEPFEVFLEFSRTHRIAEDSAGAHAQSVKAMVVDGDRNLFTAGTFSNEPMTLGSDTLAGVGTTAIFLSKQSSQGTYSKAVSLGGAGADEVYGLALAQGGTHDQKLFLLGKAPSNLTVPAGVAADINSPFLARYDPATLDLEAITEIFPGGTFSPKALVAAEDGHFYVTGSFTGTLSWGDTTLISAGDTDIVIARLDSDGALVWAQQAGSAGADEGRAIAVAADGSVFLTGFHSGYAAEGKETYFPERYGGELVVGTRYAGESKNAFLAKLDSTGYFTKVYTAGADKDGSDMPEDIGNAVALSPDGAWVYWAGHFESTEGQQAVFPNTGGNIAFDSSGGKDAFVAKHSTDTGLPDWVMPFGRGVDGVASATSHDSAMRLAVTPSGRVMVAGEFSAAGFGSALVAADEGFRVVSYGVADVFLMELAPTTGSILGLSSGGTTGADVLEALAVDGESGVYLGGSLPGNLTAVFRSKSIAAFGTGINGFIVRHGTVD